MKGTFARVEPRTSHLLPVLVELPFPLVHVGGALLQGGGQPEVVAFEGCQFHLPLLGVRRTADGKKHFLFLNR